MPTKTPIKRLPSVLSGQPGTRARVRPGFSLMELMVTLSILTVLAMLAAPAIRVDVAEADAAAHRVRAAMQHAQRVALIQQMNVIVSFDTAKRRIRIVEDKNDNYLLNNGERVTFRPLEMGNRFAAAPRRVNGLAGGIQPIVGNNIVAKNGMPSVVFRRDGSLSSDVEIYLLTQRNGKESRRVVTVTMATGRVDWYKYLGGTTWRRGGA